MLVCLVIPILLVGQVMINRGLLIAFEGIDGTGKSTQMALLADYLTARNFDVVTTREPTDGVYGRKIRSLFASRDKLTPAEELRLFVEDRREHVQKVLLPALVADKVVLTDRYYFSTAAYQGVAGHDPAKIIADNEEFAPRPDLVLLLTLPAAESVYRIKSLRGESLNDFEKEDGLAKVARIFAGFEHDYITRIDASNPVEIVHEDIIAKINEMLADKEH